MTTDIGRCPDGPGYSPKGGAADASPAKPSIPNAARPRQYDAAVLEIAARNLAARIIEDWDTAGTIESWIEPLTREMRSSRDGYQVARELERWHGISPDFQLVEILDETYSHLRDAFESELRKWVKYTNWIPQFAQGARVIWRDKHGVVNSVNAETSEVLFAPDDEAPRYRQGGGYVVSEDDLTALAAATGTAKTAQQAECEASQSGGEAVTPSSKGITSYER